MESVQYLSIRYGQRLAEVGVTASVGSVADSYDNAVAEALNGTFKAELIDRHTWPDLPTVERAMLQWSAGTTTTGFTARSATSHPLNDHRSAGSNGLPFRKFSSPPPAEHTSRRCSLHRGHVRIILTLVAIATTAFYRARAELFGWWEVLIGRHTRALRPG